MSGVDGKDAQAADDLRAVADFLRAKQEPGTEELKVLVDVAHDGIADGEGTAAGEADFVVLDQRDHRVLNHLGVHVKYRDFRVLAHGLEDGIGGVAHAGLDGQEAGGDKAALEFGGQKIGDVFADARGGVGDGAEGAGFIGPIGFDDAGDFPRIHFDSGRADAVVGAKDGHGLAMGRVCGFVDVVEAAQGLGMKTVQLNQDFVRRRGKRWARRRQRRSG